MNENMKLWESVCETDPNHVKTTSFGRKVTCPDPQYQKRRVTEQFGVIGQGWGYHVVHSIERIGDLAVLAIADVTVWLGDKANTWGPVRATDYLWKRGKEHPSDEVKQLDDDAPKKATTDALTKALSDAGFSADIFLGQYDDSKYVQALREKHSDTPETSRKQPRKAERVAAADDDAKTIGDGLADALTGTKVADAPTVEMVKWALLELVAAKDKIDIATAKAKVGGHNKTGQSLKTIGEVFDLAGSIGYREALAAKMGLTEDGEVIPNA